MEGLIAVCPELSCMYESDINPFFAGMPLDKPATEGLGMQTRTNNRQGSNIVLECRVPIRRAQAILCDISETGCRIELFDDYVSKGSTIFFEIDDRNELAGQIVWVSGAEAGVRFMHKLTPVIRGALEL